MSSEALGRQNECFQSLLRSEIFAVMDVYPLSVCFELSILKCENNLVQRANRCVLYMLRVTIIIWKTGKRNKRNKINHVDY